MRDAHDMDRVIVNYHLFSPLFSFFLEASQQKIAPRAPRGPTIRRTPTNGRHALERQAPSAVFWWHAASLCSFGPITAADVTV